MEYIISAIWIGIELMCNIFFCGAFLDQKGQSEFKFIAVFIAWLILGLLPNLEINPLVRQVVTVLLFMYLSSMMYKGSYAVHILLALICYIFIATIDTIAINGTCALLDISYDEFIWRQFTYTVVTTMDKLLACFVTWLLYRFRQKKNMAGIQNKWLLLSSLFPAVSAVMFVVFFYNISRNEDASASIVVFSGILIIANIAMLYVISAIEKATMHEQETCLLKQQISIQAENYSALKDNYCAQRKATHEFERHIQVLRDLLDQEEYDSAKNYVRGLQANRTLKVFCIHSNNSVIDVVLNQKYQLAQENGITMRVQVNDLSSIPYQRDELVVLLSNLLDNAIEACLRTDRQREILFSILEEESVYISVRNTSEPVAIVDGEIATSKPNAAEHGFGLPAVKYILERLGAEYTYAYKDGWFQFVAEIPH